MGVKGLPPLVEESTHKILDQQLAELRKSCENAAGLCISSVVASVLKNGDTEGHWATTLGIGGAVIGLIGATSWRGDKEDPAKKTARLKAAIKARHAARILALLCLLGGLVLLLFAVWAKPSH
ncbi:MAG: hypothetical protein WDO74_04640 [Pseudomonadota bacterium]